MSNQVLNFANTLVETAELLRLSTIKRRGQKSVGQRARVALTDVKNGITHIKRTILENEK